LLFQQGLKWEVILLSPAGDFVFTHGSNYNYGTAPAYSNKKKGIAGTAVFRDP
jgi:hypothetical protein